MNCWEKKEKREKEERPKPILLSCYWGFKSHSFVWFALFYIFPQRLHNFFQGKYTDAFLFQTNTNRSYLFVCLFWVLPYLNAEILGMWWWRRRDGNPHSHAKGENSLYFEFVAETQNVIREERHDVLGLCFIQLKAKQTEYLFHTRY